MLKRIKAMNFVCMVVAVAVLYSITGSALGEENGVWKIPLEANTWKASTDRVRSSEVPDRLAGRSREVKHLETQSYSAQPLKSGVRFNLISRVPEKSTMKWQAQIQQKDLTTAKYYSVRYKAHGVLRTHDRYPVVQLTGKDSAGKEIKLPLLNCAQVINDDAWHILTGKVKTGLAVEGVEIALSTASSNCNFVLDSIILSEEPTQTLQGFSHTAAVKTPDSKFKSLDLSRYFNDTYEAVSNRVLSRYSTIVDGAASFEAEQILAEQIPFNVPVNGKNIIHTPIIDRNREELEIYGEMVTRWRVFMLDRDQTQVIPVNQKVSETFFILVTEMPATTDQYGDPAMPFYLYDAGVFWIELIYADGRVDEAFPYSVSDNGFIIRRMTGVYAVPADESRKLEKIVLHNGSYKFNVNIAAATVNTSPERVLPQLTDEPKVVTLPPAPTLRPRPTYMRQQDDLIICGNTYYDLVLDCSNGFSISEINSHFSDKFKISLNPSSGIEVIQGSTLLDGKQFVTEQMVISGNTASIILLSKDKRIPLRLYLAISVDDSPNITTNIVAENTGKTTINPAIRFPVIKDVSINSVDNTWLFFPQNRAIINNRHGSYHEHNDQGFTMQFFDIYNPGGGIGLGFLTHNLNHRPLDYGAYKNSSGVSGYIHYPSEFNTFKPGEKHVLTETVLIPHSGDWNTVMKAYEEWVATWYKPRHAANRQWWDQTFLIRAEGVSRYGRYITSCAPLYNKETKKFRTKDFLDTIYKYWGMHPDMIHIGDWFHLPKAEHDVGSWGDWTYAGCEGLSNMQSLVKELRNDYNMPTSLYMIADRTSKGTKSGKRFGEMSVMRRPDGSGYDSKSTWYVCPQEINWQNYIIDTYKRVQKDTNASAMYIDVFGYWANSLCSAPAHNHHNPMWYNECTYDTIKRLREELPPEVVFWSEFVLNDVSSQYTDGNIDYSFLPSRSHFAKEYDVIESARFFFEPYTNPHRFVFPQIKQFVFPVGWEDTINSINDLKFIFFNGQSVYDNTYFLFTSRIRTIMKKGLGIMKKYSDCFTSEKPEFLVPTERAHIFANKFPGENRSVWTLYNGRYTTVRGKALSIDHLPGAVYYDLWNDKPLDPKIVNGKAIIKLKLGPQGLGCVVQNLAKN